MASPVPRYYARTFARKHAAVCVSLLASRHAGTGESRRGSALPSCTGRELRPTHAASAAARLAGRGPSNAAPHVQIDALGIVPGPADHFIHTYHCGVVYFKYSK